MDPTSHMPINKVGFDLYHGHEDLLMAKTAMTLVSWDSFARSHIRVWTFYGDLPHKEISPL